MANLIDRIPLDPGRAIIAGLMQGEQRDNSRFQRQAAEDRLAREGSDRDTQALGVLGQMVEGADPANVQNIYQSGIQFLGSQGHDVSDMPEVLDENTLNKLLTAKNMAFSGSGKNIVGSPQKLASGNIGFLTGQGNIVDTGSPFHKDKRIVMIGDVPHEFDQKSGRMVPVTVSGKQVTPESVSSSKGIVAGGVKAAESAIKQSNEAITQLGKVKLSISNINEGIAALDSGAESGTIASKLPSIRESSIRLDNVQNKMGLDVVGAVTFGALSKGELDLAKATALPVNLQPAELRKWLVAKRDAQEKFATELESAATYLGTPGNTPAGYLEMRRNQLAQNAPQQQFHEGQTATGPNGEKIVYTNGEFVSQ